MSEGKIYKDQPIPPRPSSSGAGWQSPADGKPGENSRQESGQERGAYRRQAGILNSRRRTDQTGAPTRQLGRSPWNFITEEELFSGFRPVEPRTQYGAGRPGKSAQQAGRGMPVAEKIRKLNSMLSPYQYSFEKKSRAFLEQARFMADYEEEVPGPGAPDPCWPVQRHNLPAYQELNIYELSSYFRWRTQIRQLLRDGVEEKKDWPAVCSDFAYILLFELINRIGPGSPEEGLKQIIALNRIYAGSVSWPSSHVHWWIQDYILCYEMSPDYAAEYFRDTIYSSRTVNALADPFAATDKEILAAVDMYSAYHLNRSGLREQFPAETEEATAAVVRALADYYTEKMQGSSKESAGGRGSMAKDPAAGIDRTQRTASDLSVSDCDNREAAADLSEGARGTGEAAADPPRRHDGLAVKIFGQRNEWPRQIFRGALFDPSQIDDHRYVLSPSRQFRFLKGKCYYDSFPADVSSEGKQFLGSLIRETDRRLRIALAFGRPLKEAQLDPGTAPVIQQQIDLFLARKKEREKPVLQVDFSRLSGIRADSDYTAGQLLRGMEDVGEEAEQQRKFSPSEPVDENALRPDFSDERFSGAAAPQTEFAEERPADPVIQQPVISGSIPVKPELSQDASASAAVPRPQSADESFRQAFPMGMTEEEYRLLTMILAGENPEDYLRSRRLLQSVLVDSINEKFYDEIGDSVLEEGDSGPEIIPDYREELEEIINSSLAEF